MSMERPHPLDRLVHDDSLFMLEAMIPFVDYSFKKPLVMLIKYQELNAILRCFDDPEYIAECGFDCHPNSSEDMIQSLCNVMPGYGNNMKQAMQMMNMMQMMQSMQNVSYPTPETHNSNYYENDASQVDPSYIKSEHRGTPNQHSLYDSVLSILNEE